MSCMAYASDVDSRPAMHVYQLYYRNSMEKSHRYAYHKAPISEPQNPSQSTTDYYVSGWK